ncbi:MAG: saccharopine dehydrogenase C-terminal domain-containing protein [Bacillota bacterium]
MATVLVLGAGLMGPAIASDLLKYEIARRVVVADIDPARVAEAGRLTDPARCEGKVLDIWDRRALVEAMREADVVAGAYPVAAVRQVTEAAIEAGVPLADLTGSAEGFDIFEYHDDALRAGVTLLPGCGVAPGLTNALVGQGAARLDRPLEGVIYVGGLPMQPRPPLEYRLVFSMDTVIDEYVAPAPIIKGGSLVEAEALDGLEELVFPEPVGRCEAFYTYGLGTLARTGLDMGFRELAEKTVRYPGHRDKVLFLRQCGFFSQQPVTVDGAKVIPRRFTGALLSPLLSQGDEADVTVLRVVVRGEKGHKRVAWAFEMVDFYDRETGVTSMARTTGYTCSVLIGMILRGRIGSRGVAPLERVFSDAALYEELREELARRNIVIKEDCQEEQEGV